MLDELRIRCCHGPDAATTEERGAKRQRTGAADAPEEVVPGDCCKWVGRVADYPARRVSCTAEATTTLRPGFTSDPRFARAVSTATLPFVRSTS